MFEALGFKFFQHAILVAVLASISAGIIGTYIVVKRMSMISGSIAHTAFGGLGISYYLQTNPLIGGIVFSLMSAVSIGFLKDKQENRTDTLLSFLWATGMAIGLVFIFLTPGYTTDLFTYLFGNILLVSQSDLLLIAILDIIVIITAITMFSTLRLVLFDEEYARTKNIPVQIVNVILYSLIALTIVAVIRVVGIVLMIAILTIPAATAQLFHKRLRQIMLTASAITLFATIGGLLISYYLDFATGPIIILLLSTLYVLALVGKKARKHIISSKKKI